MRVLKPIWTLGSMVQSFDSGKVYIVLELRIQFDI